MRATVALIGVMTAASAFAATTYTWDGGAGTAHLNDAENWNPDGVPSMANGDIGTITISETAKVFDLSGDFDIKQLSVSEPEAEEPIRTVLDLGGHALSATTYISASRDANFKPSAKDLWILNGSLDFYKLHHQANSCTTYSNVTLKVRDGSGNYFVYSGSRVTFFDSSYSSDSDAIDPGLGAASDVEVHFKGTCTLGGHELCPSGEKKSLVVNPGAKVSNGGIYFQNGCSLCSLGLEPGATATFTHVRMASKTTVSGSLNAVVRVGKDATLSVGNMAGTYAFVGQKNKLVVDNGSLSSGTTIDFANYAAASGCGLEINGDAAKIVAKSGAFNVGHASNTEPCSVTFVPGPTGFGNIAPMTTTGGSGKNIVIADNVIVKVDATEFLKGRVGSKSKPTIRLPLMTASGTLSLNVEALAANAELTPADGQLVVEGKTLYAEFPLPKPGLTVIVR